MEVRSSMMPLKTILREPLVHFLIAGGAVFLILELTASPLPERATAEIVIRESETERLAQGFKAVWRRAPNEEELNLLVEDHIREEVLVREALKLGLDQNDTVLRRRMRQKMEFLISSAVSGQPPESTTIKAYFAENQSQYTRPASVTFEHVFIGEAADDDRLQTSLELLNGGAVPASIGQRSLLPSSFRNSSPQEIDGAFGAGFFDQLTPLLIGRWAGPVRSGYGFHLVRLSAYSEPSMPEFDLIEDQVIEDWRREREAVLLEEAYLGLRGQYVIRDHREGPQ